MHPGARKVQRHRLSQTTASAGHQGHFARKGRTFVEEGHGLQLSELGVDWRGDSHGAGW